MKVSDTNITLYAGGQPDSSRAMEGSGREQEERKTVFAGNLNNNREGTLQDRIAEKKAKAREQAMKAVGEAFHGDLKIDEGMEESRQHVKELTEEKQDLQSGLEDIDRREDTLERAKADGEISEEEYRREKEALQQERLTQEQKLAQNQGAIQGENASIRSTRRERLKYHHMADAQNQADAIMEAAGQEIMGMVRQEAVDHADEEAEKREEQAEEIREERKEQEKLLEKQKEKREEEESWLEELSPEEFANLTKSSEDVQKEVQDMLRKMNLLDEDIKGAAVDESI
ncbi:MAG: hypothetical protein NC123_02620 [Butyrivibrio sp.]|nr:hypothetical protein [Acetatifactor muris]MCM1558435.1 hypothetical protein [Butyrivibrio sp.]